MNWRLVNLLCFGGMVFQAQAGDYPFDPDPGLLDQTVPALAAHVLADYQDEDRQTFQENRFRLQITAGECDAALETLQRIREIRREADPDSAAVAFFQYELFCKASLAEKAGTSTFDDAFHQAFDSMFAGLGDGAAFDLAGRLFYRLVFAEAQLERMLEGRDSGPGISLEDAVQLVRTYQPYLVFRRILSLAEAAIRRDDQRRYHVSDDVMIKSPQGATLSAVVMRPKRFTAPQPTVLMFTIYGSTEIDLLVARQAAAQGFHAVVADSRGKRLSPDDIVPYEHDWQDSVAVIDWISHQPWSDGQVGMFGGSYNGFTQWAAAKSAHPALKTIVPIAAAIPGFGLPMHNNVFLNANYCWAFHVTSHKTLDHDVCRDNERWERMRDQWYASGRPYREIDQVDGTPNPWLQRWLEHPGFDDYWQSMVPFRGDFAKIDIPVLTITGYFDDGQVSALEYMRQHLAFNPSARHTLLIGPYDHVGVQGRPFPVVREYPIDPVAQISPVEISFQWLAHVMRGEPRPEILKDAVNFEVMGANRWRHSDSLKSMANDELVLHLSAQGPGPGLHLSAQGAEGDSISQVIDFADRSNTRGDFYPDPVIRTQADPPGGLVFVSEPMTDSFEVNGWVSGRLEFTINKRDMDISLVLYEQTNSGQFVYLTHYLGRASHAADPTRRALLEPGTAGSVPLGPLALTSRLVSAGSRLVAVLDVLKSPAAQINYGTGRDVSSESISDAAEPLRILWHPGSHVVIPVWREQAGN